MILRVETTILSANHRGLNHLDGKAITDENRQTVEALWSAIGIPPKDELPEFFATMLRRPSLMMRQTGIRDPVTQQRAQPAPSSTCDFENRLAVSDLLRVEPTCKKWQGECVTDGSRYRAVDRRLNGTGMEWRGSCVAGGRRGTLRRRHDQ